MAAGRRQFLPSSDCDQQEQRQQLRTHRTEVTLPVNQRLSVIAQDIRPASAPSSPLTPFRTFGQEFQGTILPGSRLSSSVIFSVNSRSESPKFYSKSRTWSSLPGVTCNHRCTFDSPFDKQRFEQSSLDRRFIPRSFDPFETLRASPSSPI